MKQVGILFLSLAFGMLLSAILLKTVPIIHLIEVVLLFVGVMIICLTKEKK